MIRKENDCFILDTEHTTYCFRIMETGHPEHLYYGRKISLPDGKGVEALMERPAFMPGNANAYDERHKELSLEAVCLEMSSYGKGDIREPFIEVVHADGSYTSDFLFDGAEITKGKEPFETLPGSYGEAGDVEQLCVTFQDRQYRLTLEMYYFVYPKCDVIARSARLINGSGERVKLKRLLSMQLDFREQGYIFTTFHGAWAREMERHDVPVSAGKCVNASYTGTSSSRANPFVMLTKANTAEDYGDCYGFNLIYSGNHYEAVEADSYGRTRLVAGINPQSFCYILEPGERFEAPEAVMTYSGAGCNGMSGQMHRFVREHIVRGEWKNKERPILLNSWEANYFDIDESKLLQLAEAGKEAGIELFVMDDGWFGQRDDDTSSLGDWEANTKKLPQGLSGLCSKIRQLGLMFGIWVEPEMVNVKSRLYEMHPDWTVEIPGMPHSEGRNQRILDLTRTEVQDFIIEKMSGVFSSADISYVKWDMNRTFTDYFSCALPPERQGEVAHRYVLGLYRCMKELTKRFPHILFEGCSAGGNRFDLGILCYFPQIWASDNTDALVRAEIQHGYSYGYPASVVSAHVSACPNHQTFRTTPLETRFHVACFGVFGYECNLCSMKEEELSAVKAQISMYKEWRGVFQQGRFYRGRSLDAGDGNLTEWTVVSADGKRAVGFLMRRLAEPNARSDFYNPKGLLPEALYHLYNGRSLDTETQSGKTEGLYACGDTLMYGGVCVRQTLLGCDRAGYMQDFDSHIFLMETE